MVLLVLIGQGRVATSQTITIAALGDSLTQGYGLPPEEGFVPQLQAWLKGQERDIVVLNAGVSGDTTAGGLSRIAWTLTPDVDALIVAMGGNDVLRGIDPTASRKNLHGILQVAADSNLPVLLVGLTAPGNYGPEYKADFEAIFPDLAAEFSTLHYQSFLSELQGEEGGAMTEFLQADNIHPNKEGVARIVLDIGPFVVKLAGKVR